MSIAEAGREQLAGLIEASLRITYIEGAVNHVPATFSTGWRTLPFSVITQWRGQPVRFERAGHPPETVAAGSCVLTPPGLKHCVTAIGSGPPECRWAHFQATVLGAHDLFTLLGIPQVQPQPKADGLGDTCAGLAAQPRHGSDLGLEALARRKELDARLIGQLAALAPDGRSWEEALLRTDRMLPVLRHIQTHCTEGPASTRLTTLARIAGLSRSRFHALFHATMGMTPTEYVRRIRIAEAQRLLIATELTVARIAGRVGCADPLNFSRQFKAVCGVTPATFRNEARGLGRWRR